MNLIHDLWSSSYIDYRVGTYAGAALVVGYMRLRPHLPHRHTGYVSINGTVWNCSLCGKAPKDLERKLAQVVADAAEHPWVMLSAEARELADDISAYQAQHPVATRIIGVKQLTTHDAAGFWTAE